MTWDYVIGGVCLVAILVLVAMEMFGIDRRQCSDCRRRAAIQGESARYKDELD